MANNIDTVETGPLQSSRDGPTLAEPRQAEAPADSPAEPPVVDLPEPPLAVSKTPVSSPSTTTDVSAAPSHQSPPSYSAFANPPPKKFSAVNINKKFFQKVSTTTAAPSASSSHASTIKTGSPAPRPATQPSSSHSRLVTAKLTSTVPLSAATGSSWSRPSSATPSTSSATHAASNAQPSQPPPPVQAPPHTGKVIQPQPRHTAASVPALTKRDGSQAKPAWTSLKPVSNASFTDNATDFPTAAEVAHGWNPKPEDNKPDGSLPPKQTDPQEADAFRGVHLDPNTHHWDEMDGDDDNFLDNVIEFGDGRQYKVVPTDLEQASGDQAVPRVDNSSPAEVPDHSQNELIAKEDRFADDFDRSWPRSKISPTVLQRDFSSRSSRQASVSPASSQPSYSPLEPPRVLFNERSNRLEPYNNVYLPARLSGPPKREGRTDQYSRDAPPHGPTHPVQLLQKSTESSHGPFTRPAHSYPRDLGNTPASASHYSYNRTRGKDGEVHTRRAPSGTHSAASLDSSILLSPSQASDGIPSRHHPLRGSPSQPSSSMPPDAPTNEGLADTTRGGSSEAPLQSGMPELDVETVHKTAMHISAERARQRRQLEEEEREREKERARRKAAELEERMKAAEATKKQAEDFAVGEPVKEPVGSLQTSNEPVPVPEVSSPSFRPSGLGRSQSNRPEGRSSRDSRFSRLITSPDESSTPDHVDSWRSRMRVPPQKPPSPAQPTISAPPPVLHGGEEPVTNAPVESLEVVDFSDLGKLVGIDEASTRPSQSSRDQRPSHRGRPVASDFFEDLPTKVDSFSIREREVTKRNTEPPAVETGEYFHSSTQNVSAVRSTSDGPHSLSPAGHPSVGYPHRPQRAFTSFREAPIAVLDDVISRIKGALDNMQVDSAKEVSTDAVDNPSGLSSHKSTKPKVLGTVKTLPKEAKWLPPAMRPQRSQHDANQEVFDVTGCDPPQSPRLAPDIVVVKFPKVSRPIETISKRQLRLSTSHNNVRWDILSWDPPVEGMKRDFSINDVLFGKPKNRRYQVTFPRSIRSSASGATTGPRVHLPAMFSKVSPLSGRPRALDDLVSWRRGATLSTKDQKTEQSAAVLPPGDVTGNSPRSSETSAGDPSDAITSVESSPKAEKQLLRPRTQPKLPPGSAIGFYRDPSMTSPQSSSAVNFTVNSELQDSPRPQSHVTISPLVATSPLVTLPTAPEGDNVAEGSGKDIESPNINLEMRAESRSPDDSVGYLLDTILRVIADSSQVDRSLLTPASASFGTPWTKSPLSFSTKESPARAPDPEHLKAVWSQATDKEPAPAVNSLEGIADDLTSLPFTIQDVKSEDGETPPPTSAVIPSKISLHDVTRAFQQVPTSSSTSSHRAPPMSPQSTSGHITRPNNFNYPTPIQPSTLPMRPAYPTFPSPMLVHSPSPSLYPPPSPIPRVPVNGPSQVYNQPVWVPMQGSQNHNGAMRPMASPYTTQMMAYPPATAVPPVYGPPPTNQNPPTSANGTVHPRGMPMMSPVMHPAAPANMPIYGGSPVMMHHPPIMQASHRSPYIATPTLRGPVRTDVTATSPLTQQPHPQGQHPHQSTYSHVTPVFGRLW
ncbi:hypothetical protein ID866_832 [Astraeus odoratus]|nr:hypothetical protein ID866_832 [Astraeus odoratus]